MPIFPGGDLDSSYIYAMNEAVARRMQFGRDFVFTYGPFASIYTHRYFPATDRMMIFGSALLALSVFLVFWVSAQNANARFGVLAIPLVLSQQDLPDAVLITLPLLLMLLCLRGGRESRLRTVSVILGFGAIALLSLVKVNAVPSVFLAGAIGINGVGRNSIRLAFWSSLAFVATLALAWLSAGQSLLNLPNFFASQMPLASGFADAMSTTGKWSEVPSFIICAAALTYVAWAHADQGTKSLAAIGTAVVLFLSFKSGFVRQSGHVQQAAINLVFVGLFLLMQDVKRVSAVTFTLCVLGWAAISAGHRSVSPLAVADGFADRVFSSAQGIRHRITDASYLEHMLDRADETIRTEQPLPTDASTADLYPSNLAALFANRIDWSPRPVLQSYTAYTPTLAAMDETHLREHGAARVFFSISPIDGRYPTLEDGPSLVPLLNFYRVKAMAGNYAVLDRLTEQRRIDLSAPVYEARVQTGQAVAIPSIDEPVFAKIDLQPTLIGKLTSIAFKSAQLTLETTYADGRVADYRFIPGMASAGFLLAPTLSNASDFVALQSPDWKDYLSSEMPVSFRIFGASGTRLEWGRFFNVKLFAVHLRSDNTVDSILFKDPEKIANIASYASTPYCSIDLINGVAPGDKPVPNNSSVLRLRGWAIVSGPLGVANDSVAVALVSNDGTALAYPVEKVERADVGRFFGHPDVIMAGFQGTLNIRQVHGPVDVRIIQQRGSERYVCEKGVRLDR